MDLTQEFVQNFANLDNKEVLIPVVPEFIESVDLNSKIVTISPVEGLLN